MEDIIILNSGQRLKKIRRSLKIRQGELAGDKFSKNYISMFENNKRSINAINATYLANKINELAAQKGYEVSITASFLLKDEHDVAKDKCLRWIDEVKLDSNLSIEKVYSNLFKVLLISDKYHLRTFSSDALYFKGIRLMERKQYYCAITHLLKALNYSSEENDFERIADIYKIIGICLYKQKQLQHSIVYLNLCENIINNRGENVEQSIDEIKYYKGLCYYELGEYSLAKTIIGKKETKNLKLMELTERINETFVG